MKINKEQHITKDGVVKKNPSPVKKWRLEFDGGFIIEMETSETNRNKIMMMARKELSDNNRYNFEARRASGGRIIKMYEVRR